MFKVEKTRILQIGSKMQPSGNHKLFLLSQRLYFINNVNQQFLVIKLHVTVDLSLSHRKYFFFSNYDFVSKGLIGIMNNDKSPLNWT